MQITSLPGLYPPPIQPGRTRESNPRPVEELSGTQSSRDTQTRESGQAAAITDERFSQIDHQRVARISTLDSSVVDVVRRGFSEFDSSQNLRTRKALTEYSGVASQEQRFEYAEVFGLDVYA